MTTEAIIYSPANIDSCFAAAIMRTNADKQNKEMKTFPYNRGMGSFDAPGPFDVIHILGADLTPEDLASLFEINTSSTVFHLYSYTNSTVYTPRLTQLMSEDHRFKEHHHVGEDGFEISVSSRICKELADDNHDKDVSYVVNFNQDLIYKNGVANADTVSVKDYAGVVSLYMAFKPMTAVETLFLFSNLNNVRRAAKGLQVLVLDEGVSQTKTDQYDDYVQDVRHTVKANMCMAYYAGANGYGFHTPTICVGERDAYHAMRFINYAYDEVISYEDTRSARIYRVLSKNNLEWYIKRFEPRDIWSEGHLTYFRTELLQHVR